MSFDLLVVEVERYIIETDVLEGFWFFGYFYFMFGREFFVGGGSVYIIDW